MDGKERIQTGQTALGMEFGSTRIKAVLTDFDGTVLATGVHDWENSLVNGVWTYDLEEIHAGLADCYASLCEDVKRRFGIPLETVGVMGISAMMHGYLALDRNDHLLAPFQTWRNSNTEEAANRLTELFHFNIPLRWTAAHLYQRILDGEPHVKELAYVTTLAGYLHYRLTGQKVLGVGDASGMFPVDSETCDYDRGMLEQFDNLLKPFGYSWNLREVFPKVLTAGENAGTLTAEGAALLDRSDRLRPGIPLCPPEGDAGTGMVATNSVAPRTGNLSAGTSTFAMLVLEHPLSKMYREIDMVTTPSGFPVAMSHANNGTSDLNAWVGLFQEFAELMGVSADMGILFEKLYTHSLTGDLDCGGLLPYGYYSGEGITHLNEGRPLFVRTPESRFTLANFMRAHLYSSLGAVKLGLDILLKEEHVRLDRMLGHGGLFKTKGVMQRYLAAAVNAPVTVLDTATEGGAWGIALLAAYLADGKNSGSLETYLEKRVFARQTGFTIAPDHRDAEGFETFMRRYKAGVAVERTAVETIHW